MYKKPNGGTSISQISSTDQNNRATEIVQHPGEDHQTTMVRHITAVVFVSATLAPAIVDASPHFPPPQANIAAAWTPIDMEVFARSAPVQVNLIATATTATQSANTDNDGVLPAVSRDSHADLYKPNPDEFVFRFQPVRRDHSTLATSSSLFSPPASSSLYQASSTSTSTSVPHNDRLNSGSTNKTQAHYPPQPPPPETTYRPGFFPWKCPPSNPFCLVTAKPTTKSSTTFTTHKTRPTSPTRTAGSD